METLGDRAREGSFTILSLDGGGAKGIFTAAVLAEVESILGLSIVDHVDLIAGTSTGGLVALGLAAGRSPRELFDTYQAELASIFPPAGRRTFPATLTRSKYDPAGLSKALQGMLGGSTLAESAVPLAIPTFDLTAGAPYVFRAPTGEHPDGRLAMWQIGMAISAAPTFLPPHTIPGRPGQFIDGGIWANNPSMVGVIDAIDIHHAPLSSLRVYTIGASSRRPPSNSRNGGGGLIQWGRSPNYAEILFLGQTRAVADQVQRLLPAEAVVRIEAPAPREWTRLDTADMPGLRTQARHAGRRLANLIAPALANPS